MALGINSGVEGTTLTLELSGRLGAQEAREFDTAFAEKAQGMKQALLDFSNVEYISSAGLRVLLSAQKIMNKQGKMTIKNVCDEIKEIFEVTGFSDILTVV